MSHPGPENPAASKRTPWRRRLLRVVAVIALCVIASVAYLQYPWPIPPAASFTVISHRGVHQTFPLAGLTSETCTASIIHPPTHAFLENTIPSIAAAFAAGLRQAGILPVFKHFPGHGHGSGDSHDGSVTTPPLPISSSPMPDSDMMDVSPLPHKGAFCSSIEALSPTPLISPDDDETPDMSFDSPISLMRQPSLSHEPAKPIE